VSAAWPWLALAGLGLYHGLNPAMGWLFAVALGLHRNSRAVVLKSLVPIALGHALAIAVVVALLAATALVIDGIILRRVAAILLILWALYHVLYGVRHRARFGMRVGFAGLLAWSFLMAGMHGAGLMLAPVLMPLCLSGSAASGIGPSGPALLSLAAAGVHTASMLAVTGVIALLVYDWLGVGFLRRGWINLDLLWTAALLATGLVLLFA
jgi:hypothetical protein